MINIKNIIKTIFIILLFFFSVKSISADQIYLVLEVTDILPDNVIAYRTNMELSEAKTSVKFIYKKANPSIIEKLDDGCNCKIDNSGNIDNLTLKPVNIKYIKIDYKPLNDAPKIFPVYEKVDWTIRSPDIFEILRNKPVEVIKDITIISEEQLDSYFSDFHKTTFKYNFTVTFYVKYTENDLCKTLRTGILTVDLYN